MEEIAPSNKIFYKALGVAKINVMYEAKTAFFSRVMLGLVHQVDATIPTACTNGIYVKYNTEFFLSLTPAVRISLVLHETLHVVLTHMCRCGDRDPQKWNIAGDFVINLMIADMGFEIPEEWLYDQKYAGMTTEEVYNLLPDDCVPPNFDLNDVVFNDGNPLEKEALKQSVDDLIVQATMQSRMAGDSPGSIPENVERYVESLLKPQVPWFRVLRSFLTKMAKTDYTYRRPNKRFFPTYTLPTLYSESICDIAVGCDTSCSVTDSEFEHYIGEVGGILRNLRPDNLTFLQFDTALKPTYCLKSLSDLEKVKFLGKGGTDIDPLMDWAKENKPSVLIVFTDGYFSMPKENPGCPVIWIIHNNSKWAAPFGKVIYYKFKDQLER